MPELPCLHLAAVWPSTCLAGRKAPRDCRDGCAAYEPGGEHDWLWQTIHSGAPGPAALTPGEEGGQ